jgi:hypothetical protein
MYDSAGLEICWWSEVRSVRACSCVRACVRVCFFLRWEADKWEVKCEMIFIMEKTTQNKFSSGLFIAKFTIQLAGLILAVKQSLLLNKQQTSWNIRFVQTAIESHI